MFQNLKQKTRNREDISKLLVRLMYKVALLEKEVSEGGGGGGIQSVVEGENISIDNSDPLNPIINNTAGIGPPNTFIGNAGATLTTKELLANRYVDITANDIHNFQIDANNNISCYIGKEYTFKRDAFRNSAIPGISYYIDIDGKAVDTVYDGANIFRQITKLLVILPNWKRMEYNTFAYSSIELISIPSAIPIGYNPAANSEFQSATFLNTANIYVNKTNETINAGNPDADLTGGAAPFVKYSTNKDKPMPVNYIESTQGSNNINVTLIGKVFHSNPIDWYLVFVDGVYKGRTNTTSFDITGLNPSTSYKIKFLTIDSMGNNSKFSREFNITTTA